MDKLLIRHLKIPHQGSCAKYNYHLKGTLTHMSYYNLYVPHHQYILLYMSQQ